jgi:Protein of unknown function (DUF3575)
MKKYLFFILLSTTAVTVSAQVGAVKIGLASLYNGNISGFGIGGGITLEYRISRKFTFSAAFDYTSGDATAKAFSSTITSSFTSTAFSFRPEFRLYFKEAMKGFFLGVGVGLGNYKSGSMIVNNSTARLEIGSKFLAYPALMFGLNVQPTPNFCIELSGGIGASTGNEQYNASDPTFPFALRLGYSF